MGGQDHMRRREFFPSRGGLDDSRNRVATEIHRSTFKAISADFADARPGAPRGHMETGPPGNDGPDEEAPPPQSSKARESLIPSSQRKSQEVEVDLPPNETPPPLSARSTSSGIHVDDDDELPVSGAGAAASTGPEPLKLTKFRLAMFALVMLLLGVGIGIGIGVGIGRAASPSQDQSPTLPPPPAPPRPPALPSAEPGTVTVEQNFPVACSEVDDAFKEKIRAAVCGEAAEALACDLSFQDADGEECETRRRRQLGIRDLLVKMTATISAPTGDIASAIAAAIQDLTRTPEAASDFYDTEVVEASTVTQDGFTKGSPSIALGGTWLTDYNATVAIRDDVWYSSADYGTSAYTVELYTPTFAVLHNPADAAASPSLFTKVMWHAAEGGGWAYCMVVYDAATAAEALTADDAAYDSEDAATGCAGFPHTVMTVYN